jgi:hypothetical protein
MNEAREIFEVYYKDIMKYIILDLPDGDKKHNIKISQDTALKQLRELVERKKKEYVCEEVEKGRCSCKTCYQCSDYNIGAEAFINGHNSACDDIADMIYKEEK